MKTAYAGGSSSVLRNAFHADLESMCAFVKNINLVGRSERERVDAFGQRANILHAVIARGIDLVAVVLGTANRVREDARATEVFPSPREPAKRYA